MLASVLTSILLLAPCTAQDAEAVAAKKQRLGELLKELLEEPSFFGDDEEEKRWKAVHVERDALMKALAGDDPARIEDLENELLGFPRSEEERDALRKRLAELNRKILEESKRASDALFKEESQILRKLLRGRVYSDDRDRVTQEALKKHAPDIYDAWAETTARDVLLNLYGTQLDFRSNDRDNNHRNDYWVGDLYGLQFLCPFDESEKACRKPHVPMKLLSPTALAAADAAPLRGDTLSQFPPEKPVPYWGYVFGALARDDEGLYDDGSRRNPKRFGFYAVPASYREAYRSTFVINQENRCWKKDTGGKAPASFPSKPDQEGWTLAK